MDRSPGASWGRRAVVLAILGLGMEVGEARAASPVWLRTEGEGFTIYSDASPKDVVEVAVAYAAYRRAFSELFASPGHIPPPATLVLFRRASEFHQYTPPAPDAESTMTNFSTEVDGRALIALSVAGDRDTALALTFEFETVGALKRIGCAVPLWQGQGAGEVLSTLRVAKGKCLVGGSDDRPSWPSDKYPWPHFFEIGTSSPEYNNVESLGAYSSQMWTLIHWILYNGDGGRERFSALATKLRKMPALPAVEAVMGVPSTGFSSAIRRHLREYRRPHEYPFDEAKVRAGLREVPVAEAEVLAVTASLLEASGRKDESERNLARARQLAPNLPCVMEAQARAAMHNDREYDGLRLYREVIATGSASYFAYLCSARARLDDSSAGGIDHAGMGGHGVALALGEIRQALERYPECPAAYQLMARALYLSPNITPDEINELRPGATASEVGENVRLYQAFLWQRLGKLPEYQAALDQVLGDPDTSAHDLGVAASLVSADLFNQNLEKVKALVGEKRLADARQLIDQAEVREKIREGAQRYRQLREWLNAQAAP